MSERRRALGGASFLLAGALGIQLSSAYVQGAFGRLGPAATSGWRFLLGAAFTWLVVRPKVKTFRPQQWRETIILGLAIAFMNQCFYQAIARIPLGNAVAIEYLGPFAVAALSRRTIRHVLLVVLAGLGVLALTRPGSGLNGVGALFAAGSGVGWALYILAAHRVGGTTKGLDGLAVSLGVSALVNLPFSLPRANVILHAPALLGRMVTVGLLSTILGLGPEMQGLRMLKPSSAGVLMAMEPAMALWIGLIFLHQHVSPWDYVGMAAVVGAGVGVTLLTPVGTAEVVQ